MKKKTNILIVDDLEENRYLIENILKGKDYNVMLASNGIEALGVLKAQQVDLIISDILMPEMDGFKFCQECRSNDQLKDIPFIFITATYTDKKDEDFALSLGAQCFITKPLNPEDIIEKVKEVIQADKKGKQKQTLRPALKEDPEFLKQYSQRVAKKLEQTVYKLEKEMAERKKAEKALNMVQEGTSYKIGTDFFCSLVRHLATALGVRYALLAKVSGAKLELMEVLTAWNGAEFVENFNYNLKDTPCANVVSQGFCLYPSEVQKKFPKDQLLIDMGVDSYIGTPLRSSKGDVIGILVVMDDKPIKTIPHIETAMKIFATRAATELERHQVEEALRNSETDLRKQRDALEQKNIALKEVLAHIETEKQQIKNDVIANVDHILIPTLNKVRMRGGTHKHIDLLKSYLNDMTSSLGKKLTEKSIKLTTREIEICAMIKNGMVNKEIASLLSISLETVEKHRRNIRKKLGISKKDINLTSFLRTI